MIVLEFMALSVVFGIPLGIVWRLVDNWREKTNNRQVAAAAGEESK
jgi:hypothetical protein